MKMLRYATQALNGMSDEQIRDLQWKRLRRQIEYCLSNSDFYRRRFKDLGIDARGVQSLDDFFKLPVIMNKEQERLAQLESMEREGHPFGAHLCCRPEDVAVTATTSGTTGEPTFTYTLSHNDLHALNASVALMLGYAGVLPGERVLFAHALGIYATSAILPPLRAAGILPIDVDVRGGADAIIKFAEMTRPVAMMTTPSLAQFLIDRMPDRTGRPVSSLNFKALILVGEIGVGIPEVKQKLEAAYGCRAYDWIAMFAQNLAFSSDSDTYHGMHAVTPDTDLYPMDLIDPETGKHIEPVDGAVGEAVCTSLNRQARPVLRYATGDMVKIMRGDNPAGFPGYRFRVVGRSDDMLIVKGANIYPAAIRTVINEFIPEVTGQMRIVLTQPPPRVEPPLIVSVERGVGLRDGDLPGLEARIKKVLHERVRLTPVIEWVAHGQLERAMTKTPMFEHRYQR